MDYKETIKERLNILSTQLKAFILDENWRREAEKVGKQFNFDEEKYASLENEIFLVLLCFEPKTDFIENVKRELGLDANVAVWIAGDINKNIFSKVSNEINEMWRDTEENEEKSEGVGESFEQIILNQAKAMRPAQAPENLPTENSVPKATHDYAEGNDPYREPIQ